MTLEILEFPSFSNVGLQIDLLSWFCCPFMVKRLTTWTL
uniref:Uncharacterized protein n=1 Tax=Rhizophora mucronata TaxID=61149 RepID=A0A2P2NAC5_RHIMU